MSCNEIKAIIWIAVELSIAPYEVTKSVVWLDPVVTLIIDCFDSIIDSGSIVFSSLFSYKPSLY